MKSYVKYILGGMALLLIGWIAGFEWGVKVGLTCSPKTGQLQRRVFRV